MLECDEIVKRWAKGLAEDITALGGLLSPTARIWHSTDGVWLSRDVAQARMTDSQAVPVRFREVRHHTTGHGGVIQATLERDGAIVHIVQVLTVEADQISALEEYIAPQSATA